MTMRTTMAQTITMPMPMPITTATTITMEGIKWTSRATLRLSGRPILYNVMFVVCQVKNLGEIRLVAVDF